MVFDLSKDETDRMANAVTDVLFPKRELRTADKVFLSNNKSAWILSTDTTIAMLRLNKQEGRSIQMKDNTGREEQSGRRAGLLRGAVRMRKCWKDGGDVMITKERDLECQRTRKSRMLMATRQ